MALEFICARRIVEGKEIALPRHYNGKVLKYEIDIEGREIAFFYDNNEGGFALNTWTAPEGARKVVFSIYREHGQSILNAPVFYNSKGEILKIGNR